MSIEPEESATDSTTPLVASESKDRPPAYVWEGKVPDGAQLAALRRGWNAEPGTVPALWPHYRHLSDDGRISPRLRAEHLALTLFGLHQQGKGASVHVRGRRLGQALRVLRRSGRYSEAAVDRRVAACATADDLNEFGHHLRALISMVKTVPTVAGLDYTQLVQDLADWQRADRVGRVRRQFARDYFNNAVDDDLTSSTPDPAAAAAN